jgi:integrase
VLVSEWIVSFWKVLNVKPKTLYDYQGLYRRHLEPSIGNVELDKVDPIILQRLLLDLPPQTARHTLMLAKSIYREAHLYKTATSNPTLGLRTPTIQMKPKKFLTWDEVNQMDWGKYENQIKFLALHGLRWSEAVALTDDDIHDGYVWVNKSIYGTVKSASSNRKVPYLGYFSKFPSCYKTLRKVANRGGISIHSLRRTYAYLLKTKGVHVTTAQKLLGHSDPMMTLKVYTSVLDSEIDDAGLLLKEVLK